MLKKDYLKFVFIGAGSSAFTMRLVGDILAEECIKSGELALVDIDSVILKDTADAVRQLLAHVGRDFKLTTYTDFKQALPEADFVYITIATGGYARWKKDVEICTKHNVLMSVGDTIGAGGIIRTLRTIPVVVDIAHEMGKICPDAWIINYANPEGAVCLALQKYTKIKSFGLCHGTPGTARWLAEDIFQVEKERFSYRAAGINHFTWFLEMKIDGHDVYPELRAKMTERGIDKSDPVTTELFDIYGCFPAPGDRHVEEFVPYYLREEIIKEYDLEWKNNDFVVIDEWRVDDRKALDNVRIHNTGYDEFLCGSGETATYFIRALMNGEPAFEMVNVINNGYIDNVSSDIIIELPTHIDQFGLHPQKIGNLPAGIAAQCDRLGREYAIMVDAAVKCDYKLARQAMFLDPLSANCKYPEELLKDLIRENLDLLPAKWQDEMEGIL